MRDIFIVLIILVIGFVLGFTVSKATNDVENNVTNVTCPQHVVCEVCEKPKESICLNSKVEKCEPIIQIQNNTIVKTQDCSVDKAEVYLSIAKKQLKDYYRDFELKKYESCANKTIIAEDNLLNAIGMYQLAKEESKSKTYEKYLTAMSGVKNFCANTKRDENSRNDVIGTYEDNYEIYESYSKKNDIDVVFIE